MLPKKTYTVKEVARLLGFSTNTVYKYLSEGKIKATRLGKEGRFRIPGSEVTKFLGTPLPEPFESGVSLVSPEIFEVRLKDAPGLFDWFIGFLSIGLGYSQFIFPGIGTPSLFGPFTIYI